MRRTMHACWKLRECSMIDQGIDGLLKTKTDYRDKDRTDKAALIRLKQELGKG